MMYGHEKSDHAIVAGKPANKAGGSGAGLVGGRAGPRGMRANQHAPDSEPGKRGTGRWLVYGTELPSIPEVGAVCGKAARTDLGGGREVTRVPTAKLQFCCAAYVAYWHKASHRTRPVGVCL